MVLVKPLCQPSNPVQFFIKPLESQLKFVRKDLVGNKPDHEMVEDIGESVVVDEIIVTDNIGNDLMLPDDSFSLESAL